MEQTLLRAAHNNVLLGQVGGHADAVQIRAGRARTSVVSGAARTGNRPVHDMRDIGNRQQRNLRPVERATARRRPRFGLGATGLFLFVMLASRFVQQRGNVFS